MKAGESMRRNFAQILKDAKIDIKVEYQKLYGMLYDRSIQVSNTNRISVYDELSTFYLLEQVDFNKYSNGSTIPHLYYKDYSCEKVRIPDIKEQAAIAEVLSTADREIELLQQDIEQEKQKKKALMQLLLMGIVRVKI